MEELISGYDLNGLLILYAKQVVATNRLLEDLRIAEIIIRQQAEELKRVSEQNNG